MRREGVHASYQANCGIFKSLQFHGVGHMHTLRWHARTGPSRGGLLQVSKSMKAYLLLALMLLIANTAWAGEPSLVKDRELSLGGVAIGDTEASALRRLGQPVRRIDTGDVLDIRLEYDGLTVWLGEQRRVGEVLSVSKRHCTPSGVCPGMSFDQATKKYGQTLAASREDGAFMEYPSSGSSCWLQFAVDEGKIASVRAECQP